MTVVVDAFDSVTVNARLRVPLLPSATVASLIEALGSTGAASSLVIVPVAVARPMVAPDGFDSVRVKVSVGSTAVSPWTAMVMTWDTCPAANVTVPVLAV